MAPAASNGPPVLLGYPLAGSFRARNSPARRVPSHGTDLMGTAYAIDLIPVDQDGRSAPWSWRAVSATERPKAFVGFGTDVMSPAAGRVVVAARRVADHSIRQQTAIKVINGFVEVNSEGAWRRFG